MYNNIFVIIKSYLTFQQWLDFQIRITHQTEVNLVDMTEKSILSGQKFNWL